MAQDSKVATELRKKANNADGIADSYEGQRQEKWFRGFAEVMRTGAREIDLLELEKELLIERDRRRRLQQPNLRRELGSSSSQVS